MKWDSWIARRLPAKSVVTLTHKGIFILPSAFGIAWLLLILLLYIFGTNYQNNLIIGLSLLLASLFHTCLIYSYKNLAGLTFSVQTPPEAHAGETLPFPVKLTGKNNKHSHTTHQQICLNFAGQRHIRVHQNGEQTITSVPFEQPKRGRIQPGRITVSSNFPLGLCRAWSYVDLDIEHVVYAKPSPSDIHLSSIDSPNEQAQLHGKLKPGVDDYKGLKSYVPGESLKQVAWKQWAQGKGMLTKEFAEPEGAPVWLTFNPQSYESLELQLSHLAWQVDTLTQAQQMFGLQLNGKTIEPDTGEAHRQACQTAIALFGKPDLNQAKNERSNSPQSTRGKNAG
ncbi:DUF58 domain-containing protein [Shewanella maritima]|uniref:DUF58 domain-containing protein n=1 Tax=Shewanella maritima TaxID=2520507 RepID=UPI003735E171